MFCTCTGWAGTARPTSQAPRNSDFYQEWLHDKGNLQPKEHNIYRQKFIAYYGRSIADGGRSAAAVCQERGPLGADGALTCENGGGRDRV